MKGNGGKPKKPWEDNSFDMFNNILRFEVDKMKGSFDLAERSRLPLLINEKAII